MRRPLVLLRLLCLSVLALGWQHAAGAVATTFALMEPSDLARSAGAALVGQVTAIESGANASGGIFTEVTVHVDEALKGAFPAAEVTLTQPGGTFGGKRLTIQHIYRGQSHAVGHDRLRGFDVCRTAAQRDDRGARFGQSLHNGQADARGPAKNQCFSSLYLHAVSSMSVVG